MDGNTHRSGGASALVVPVLLALIFLALLNVGNEIRYQGCISRQSHELGLFLGGNHGLRPVACHRVAFFH
jgi:hypothetical protein